jgi:hypothetical protein
VNIYYTFTFLIYVYPSKVYFEEFWQTSIIGKCLKKIQSRMRTNNTFTVLSEIHISGLEISITEKTSGL